MGLGWSRHRSSSKRQLPGNEPGSTGNHGSFKSTGNGDEGQGDGKRCSGSNVDEKVTRYAESREKDSSEAEKNKIPEGTKDGIGAKAPEEEKVQGVDREPVEMEEAEMDDEIEAKEPEKECSTEKEENVAEEKEKADDDDSKDLKRKTMEEDGNLKDNDAAAEQTSGVSSHGAKATPVSHGTHAKSSPGQEDPSPSSSALVKWPWKTSATTVPEVVDEVWSQIDDQCRLFPLSMLNLTQSLTGWKVVRLFVSSTFHDFQNEREVLVKKVFPELKEWCERHRIHFIECDLRWGVPKDSTTRTVLCTCMEEIDRCHEDTEGEAFFLNMLGERYGWIPTKDDVPDDIAEKYQWVGNASITHMEILHGAYRFCNRNAAFFLRDIEGMPEDVRARFADPTDLGLAQIDRLKKKLAERFPDQTQTYTCQYDPSDTVNVKLSGLQKFGQDVLEYFKHAIERKYPHDTGELSAEQLENDRQVLYLGHKGQLVYGREREIKFLMDYVTGKGVYPSDGVAKQWRHCCGPGRFRNSLVPEGEEEEENETEKEKETEEEKETKEGKTEKAYEGGEGDGERQKVSHPPVAVVAQSGQGKTSLMARFIIEAKQAGLNVFFHLIGCSGDSLSLCKMLVRLCQHMASNDDEQISKISEMATEDVIQLCRTLLKEYVEEGKQLLIVIDDLTQLQMDNTEWSDWMPADLEGSVYMVCSLVSEDRTMSTIQAQVPTVQFLELGHLDQCARQDIVENFFAQYNKKLDPEQLDLLTKSKGAENALWLALACEELRVFGTFDALTNLIRNLSDSLEGLVCDILHRLAEEDETGLVEKALCYLECSMKGLTEQEMECLLGDFETKTPVPKLYWAMVRRTLKPFLRKVSGMCKVECLTFFHHAIGQVVRVKWLSDRTQLEKYHLSMADYYQHWYEHVDGFGAKHAAFHLSKANDRTRLIGFIRKDKRSRLLGPVLKSRYLKTCRCQTMIQKQGPFHTELSICNFCASQRNAFGNEAWPNAQCCVLCGNFVPPIFRKADNIAYRCQWHPLKGPRLPNAKTCMLCSRAIMKGQEKPAYLCHFCQLGGFPTCCNLNTGK